MKRILVLLVLSLFPLFAYATVWKIVPVESSLTFTAIQNNAPVSGKFSIFSGDIDFDPAKLDKSSVNIVVNMASVLTSYAEVGDALKSDVWFDVKLFPQAVFKASRFIKTKENTYEAQGNLTIRDKTIPVTLLFTIKDYSAKHAKVEGATVLKRRDFGVGSGEWESTDTVKDDVDVKFVINAIPK